MSNGKDESFGSNGVEAADSVELRVLEWRDWAACRIAAIHGHRRIRVRGTRRRKAALGEIGESFHHDVAGLLKAKSTIGLLRS